MSPLDLSILAPDGMSAGTVLALLLLSFMSSALTAMLSLGGGIAMLAGLGLVLPPAVLIPFHGCIQLGSNFGRAVVQRAFIQWHLVLWFGIGTVIGSLLGGSIAVSLPENLFRLLIGTFILYSVWGPQPRVSGRGPFADVAAGMAIGALGMIIGAVGPLVANFLRKLSDRRQLIATQATLLVFNNLAKISAFVLFGVALGQYVPLILAMVVTGFGGTVAGSRLLDRMPERGFRILFKLVLTVLALGMLRAAVLG